MLVTEELGGEKQKLEVAFPDHKIAIKHVLTSLRLLMSPFGHWSPCCSGCIYLPVSAVADDKVLAQVREVAPLHPLHNYAEADAIEICRELFPEVGDVTFAILSTSICQRRHIAMLFPRCC